MLLEEDTLIELNIRPEREIVCEKLKAENTVKIQAFDQYVKSKRCDIVEIDKFVKTLLKQSIHEMKPSVVFILKCF
jgi:hypothetical protein